MTHVGLDTLSLQNLDEFIYLTHNELLQIPAPISHLETLKVSTFISTILWTIHSSGGVLAGLVGPHVNH